MAAETFEIVPHRAVTQRGSHRVRPDANSPKLRVFGESFQQGGKGIRSRLEIANEAREDRFVGGEIEDPLVVLGPWAGFQHDGGTDSQRTRECHVFGREYRPVEPGLRS